MRGHSTGKNTKYVVYRMFYPYLGVTLGKTTTYSEAFKPTAELVYAVTSALALAPADDTRALDALKNVVEDFGDCFMISFTMGAS